VRRIEVPGGGAVLVPTAPEVVVEVCRCGCTPRDDGSAAHPDWPLAQAWAWLTAPVETQDAGAEDGLEDDVDDGLEDDPAEVDPASLPWWDARAQPGRRRAVLPLVLLGELQAGVLLRAVYEVVTGGAGPSA
jgi:hypothetical protein